MPKKKTLVILDGNALLHRAWHALPPLTDSRGRVVNAVYGFTSVLLKMFKEHAFDYFVVTFDKAGPTFRHKEYAEYKATRVKQPDELYEQIPIVKQVLQAFKIPVFEESGYEADDVIGTISRKLDPRKDVESIIVTGDLDTLQLVDDNTKVLTFAKGISQTVLYNEKEVKERYGFGPKKLIDFKAIKGDPSDNIPGVMGIGTKGAEQLIKEFGTLENIYKQIKKHPERFKKPIIEKLKQGEKSAKLSKKLVSIITDLPIKFDLKKCALGKWNREELVALFAELGFKSLLDKLPGKPGVKKSLTAEPVPKGVKTKTIKSLTDIKKILKQALSQKEIALSLEMQDASLFGDTLRGLGLCYAGDAYFLELSNLNKAELKDFWKQAEKIFSNEKIKKVGHDLKKDALVLKSHGIGLKGLYFDIMIASYLLASGTRTHDLETIIFQELHKEFNREKSKDYFAEKIAYIWQLKSPLETRLKEQSLEKLFHEIEIPLVYVLSGMEEAGVKIDVDFLKDLAKQVDSDLKKISQKIYKLAGEEFNINSPQQLQEILFEKLAIPTDGIRRGKTGLSTAASELWKLRDKHPIIDLIFEHRELSKLLNTYIEALPRLVQAKTGRIHTSFNQTVTATGRLSSSNPNLQNIPIRGEMGREIRKAFVAERGNVLLAADYSQIELRIVAALAGDERMIRAFQENKDIHTITAMAIWGIPENKVDKDMRRASKAINFGIIYGQGPRGLAESADISFSEAKEFIEKYFKAYKKVKEYMDRTKALAHKLGYVETLFGRRRYLPDLKSGLREVRAAAERMAINMPVQGTAADLMKLAMIKIHENLSKTSKKSKMILQVHDELVFEVPKDEAAKVGKFIKEEMENVYRLKVPILVTLELGKNWGEMKELKI